MVKLSSTGEVGQFVSVTQFDGGSLGKCGFYAAATVNGSAAVGGTPSGVSAIAYVGDKSYVQYDGLDQATNLAGMTQDVLAEVLTNYHCGAKTIGSDWSSIKSSLLSGYPVIICVPEIQVFDTGVGGSPYPWDSTGINHIILITGIAPDGNVLVRDSANIVAPNTVRPGPRTYRVSGLVPYWATQVTPQWFNQSSSAATPAAQEVETVIELDTPGVSQFWEAAANGAWRCKAAGHNFLMLGNIRSFYVRFGNSGLNGITYLGLPLTDMFLLKTNVYAQLFERGFVIDDTDRVIDSPVGLVKTEHCYLGHLDSGQGLTLISQPVATPLNNQIKSLDAQLAAAKTANADPAQIAALQAQIKTAQSEVSTYQAKVQQAIALLQKGN